MLCLLFCSQNYKKKLTYTNVYATFYKIFIFCNQNRTFSPTFPSITQRFILANSHMYGFTRM